MVDETLSPIDFKAVDEDHVEDCARRGRCGICGGKIRQGPIAFIGPDDGRTCFADPWMHPACADLAMKQCPFLTGRRDWREAEARTSRC
jgi:ferredoxin